MGVFKLRHRMNRLEQGRRLDEVQATINDENKKKKMDEVRKVVGFEKAEQLWVNGKGYRYFILGRSPLERKSVSTTRTTGSRLRVYRTSPG
jgi:hypothetical protein